MARKSQKDKDDEVLSRIIKRTSDWFDYYSENNDNYSKVTKFVYLDDYQWTDNERTEYDQDGRPRLSFNMLPRYITNLAAEFAENVPDVEVRSEHFTEVDQHRIDLMTNLSRNISLDSRNDVVYMTAAQNAWTGGYGAFRIMIERERPGSFNFVIRYKAVYDPTTCFWDPMARLVDKSDGMFCGVAIPMNKDEFKSKYPGVEMPKPLINEQQEFVWISEEQITVVDYWEKVPIKREFALLSDNTVVPADQAEDVVRKRNKAIKLMQQQFPAQQVQPLRIEKIEAHDDFKIKYYRAIKDKILESEEWEGKVLPVIFMGGSVKWVHGKERTYGLVFWMRDAQRAYNYARSEYLYRLQLTRYEKFLVSKENVANNEAAWKDVYKAKGALVYKRGPNGEIPIVIPPQSIGNDLQNEMTRSLSDLQTIPGRFDANFGAPSNELSGVHNAMRQRSGNLNVKEFFDNASKAIESGLRATVDLIPKVYDTARRVSITTKEGDKDSMMINDSQQNEIPSEEVVFNVQVKTGSSFAIQQSENVQKLIELVKVNPKLADLVSDIIVENLDLQQGPQMVERIQRWAIPTIAASEGSKDEIVQHQAQKAQQNPQQQLTMQAMQLEMQSKQLEMQKQQQDIMLDKMKAQDDRVKALSSQASGQANLMNAQTNQQVAQVKGVIETQKLQTEQQKAEMELQGEIIRLQGELAKAGRQMEGGV